MKKKQFRIKNLTMAALFAAVIFIMTTYLKLLTPTGYVHAGDAAVCIAAAFLPFPYGTAAAALGAGLSDLLGGYFVWVPATVVIKALMTLAFKSNSEKILCARNIGALVLAGMLNVILYYIGGAVIYGSFAVPVAEILPNLAQSAVNAVLFVIVAGFVDTHPSLRRILRGNTPVGKTER